jgi:predicted GIY-YIG superfamily endonuclease
MTSDRVDTEALTEAMAERAEAEFKKWLREDKTALSKCSTLPSWKP